MISKIKRSLLLIATSLMLMAPGLVPAMASANTISESLCTGANNASGGSGPCTSNNNGDTIQTIANTIVKWFSIIVGSVAVIMVIYGGFRYITSGGDSGNVSAAKNTLIYAIVGLLIVALAQLIVHFVLGAGTNISSGN